MAIASTEHPLRAAVRPGNELGEPLRIVDLFAGCGGLSLGLEQAARAAGMHLEIALAVDFEPVAAEVYRRNFPYAERVEAESVETFFDGGIGDPMSFAETRIAAASGDVDVLLGGPPCQGHSNLNNRTRRIDPKNALYLRMVRAAEVLGPRLVVIENVPAVLRDRHADEGVVASAIRSLRGLHYDVAESIVELAPLGVAQRRRRHVMLAVARSEGISARSLFEALPGDLEHDLRWAIGDLLDTTSEASIDHAPQAKSENLERMRYLLENDLYDLPNRLRPACQQGDHSYKSMYGRLRWDEPSQTITSGFGSIGQGRYMHPDRLRALTAHEAARLQGFPDYFDFSSCPTRHALATMIGNAVPPVLSEALLGAFLSNAMDASDPIAIDAVSA